MSVAVSIAGWPTATDCGATSVVNPCGGGCSAIALLLMESSSPPPVVKRMWNEAPLAPPLVNVFPWPQSRTLARCPPQATTAVDPSAVNVRLIPRSTLAGSVPTPIGVERSGLYLAPSRAAPQAEKWPSAWPLPLGNVVCGSFGTGKVLGACPQACGPSVSAMPPHGRTCCAGGPGHFSLALYVPR